MSDKWTCHKAAIVLCCMLSAAGHVGVKLVPLAFQNRNQTYNNSYLDTSTPEDKPITTDILIFLTNRGRLNQGNCLDALTTPSDDIFTHLFLCVFVLEIVAYGIAETASGLSDALTYDLLGEERRSIHTIHTLDLPSIFRSQ